jgi:hypothetical protein
VENGARDRGATGQVRDSRGAAPAALRNHQKLHAHPEPEQTMDTDFRITETGITKDSRCGHKVAYRVCEELVEGRWEPFVSGGVCLKCRKESR